MHTSSRVLSLLLLSLIPALDPPARPDVRAPADALAHDPARAVAAPGKELRACMENMKEQLKGLAMALQAQDGEAALEHVAELQRFVLQAKLLEPANLREVPREERPAHVKRFRAELAGVLAELAGLEIDLLEDRPEAAFGRITGALLGMREGAHERYQAAQ